MNRHVTDAERADVGRASFELQHQFGRDAYKIAAKRAAKALANGDAEAAQFWQRVEAALRPRSAHQ